MCNRIIRRAVFLSCTAVAVALAASTAPATPVPALDFRFGDATGSTVPNHGHLSTLGDGTLAAGTTIGSDPTPLIHGGYEGYLVVDSSADLMSTIDIDSIDTCNDLTLSFWVKPTGNYSSWRDMFGDCSSSSGNHGNWYFEGRDFNSTAGTGRGMVLVGYNSTGNSYHYNLSAEDYITRGEWQQLTVVISDLQVVGPHSWTAEFYRNGEFFSSFSSPTTSYQMKNTDDGFKIGNAMWDSSLYAQYAGVALFDTALSADDVRDYYTFVSTPEPTTIAMLGLGLCCLAIRRRRR